MAYPTPASSFPQNNPHTENPPSHPHYHRPAFTNDASASTSTSTADHPYNDYYCDVFINHRGPDTKKTFASALYNRLQSHGLRVFLDQPELQEGESIVSQIEGAIRTASVHVAIFSPRYAESPWCLVELVLMLESGAPILPVFYNVKPSELRWNLGGNGRYAQALRALEEKQTSDAQLRYNPATIENWRNALSTVAEISGLELEAFNGDQGLLLEKLVEFVLKRVKKTRLNVAKYPTGLDDEVKYFENAVLWQRSPSRNPKVVGIFGSGGLGKTTLAKELFNRKSKHYTRSCFIFDVRVNADKPSLLPLQKQLLKSLVRFEPPIENTAQGIEMLKEHLPAYPALIVLDDVDNRDQIYELFPVEINTLSLGSLIIITTRNKDVLREAGLDDSAIYKLPGLNEQHSRELFCSHAFGHPYPLPDFESLVSEFVESCQRLPLSLKVFGALLRGKNDRAYWKAQLDKLKQILPKEIKQTLKISYDALDIHEQEMFLDIACFFVGEKKDMAIRIWDGAGWHGWLGFETLESRCLVEMDTKYKIKMHDHLRDMGREIAEASGLQRRIWRRTDNINDLLQQSYVIQEVRGVRMVSDHNTGSSRMSWYERWVHKLFLNPAKKITDRKHNTGHSHAFGGRNFQLLDAEDSLVKSISIRLHLPNLIWLRWRKCRDSFLPSSIPMGELRVLHVFGRVLIESWQGKNQVPLQLRELVIVSPLSKLPKSIGQLLHLELLVLKETRLKTLPEEICRLPSLKRLELTNCTKIKSLPDSFGCLTKLEHIDLSSCSSLKSLPDTFGNLIRLKHLVLKGCSHMTISNETLGDIRGLEYIDLSYCAKIEVLPPQVERQPLLEKFLWEGTNIKEVPSAFEELSDSEEIVLENHLLETQPPSPGDLNDLKKVIFENCKELRCLPDSIRLLTHLTKLTVYNCGLCELSFKKVQGEAETLRRSRGQRRFRDVDSEVTFSQVVCPDLQHLRIVRCSDLVEVGTLPNKLRRLEFTNCSNLRNLEGLYGLSRLQMLNINGAEAVEELPSIETLVSLEELFAVGCEKLRSIGEWSQLTKLRKINLSYCHELEELPSVEHLKSLEVLQAFECLKIKRIRGLMQLTKLRVLDVSECSELEQLPGIEHCMSLKRLDAYKCPKLHFNDRAQEPIIRGNRRCRIIRVNGRFSAFHAQAWDMGHSNPPSRDTFGVCPSTTLCLTLSRIQKSRTHPRQTPITVKQKSRKPSW